MNLRLAQSAVALEPDDDDDDDGYSCNLQPKLKLKQQRAGCTRLALTYYYYGCCCCTVFSAAVLPLSVRQRRLFVSLDTQSESGRQRMDSNGARWAQVAAAAARARAFAF